MKIVKPWILAITIALFAVCFTSCEEDTPIPYTKVDFNVNIHTNNLIHIGGYEYFSGGISGIIIYRLDMNTFYAYDRACPFDWQEGGRVEVDSIDKFTLIDYKCGSTFNILNGYPIDGLSNRPLRIYNASLINDITLRVYN